MKPTLAAVIFAAFATCLLTIDRITAAPPASDDSAQVLGFDAGQGLIVAAEAASGACCENGACCEKCASDEKSCAGECASCPDCSATQCAECTQCTECSASRSAALKRTGLEPYVIDATDILAIRLTKGPAKPAGAAASSADIPTGEYIVQPDGRIHLDGCGCIHVAGMTATEAEAAIEKALAQDGSLAADISVDLFAKNSKHIYIIVDGEVDYATCVPCAENTTVIDALQTSIWPHPINFANTDISVHRPNFSRADEQGVIEAEELILHVDWDSARDLPKGETNFPLLPGDRLFVTLPATQDTTAPAVPLSFLPQLAATQTAGQLGVVQFSATKSACASGGCCASQAAAAQPCKTSAPCAAGAPCTTCVPSTIHYSALPAAAPSPFARCGDVAILSPPLIATQAYAATLPLAAPPEPVASTEQMAPAACASPAACAAPASAAAAATQATPCTSYVVPATLSTDSGRVTQVLFSVDVIEDPKDCLQEFRALKGDMPLMTAESEIILTTLRILERQELVRRVSSPRLIATMGTSAGFQVGTETPTENGGEPAFRGDKMEVSARELGGGLEIVFNYCQTSDAGEFEVATSMMLSHGQSVVMKTCRPQKKSAGDGETKREGRPVYVVLTPQILK